MTQNTKNRDSDPSRVRRSQIEETLRAEIINGQIGLGDRLPIRTEIEERFGAGAVTVQHALNRLIHDGFVVARGSRGTFVSDNPPHLSRYALIFAANSQETTIWGRFWQAMVSEAEKIDRDETARRMPCFYEIQNRPDTEDYQVLVRDIRNHRLAGLIFATNPNYLHDTPIMDEPGVPRVFLGDPLKGLPFPVVQLGSNWFDRAVESLVHCGRRRIAVLIHAGAVADQHPEDLFRAAIKKHGLEQPAHWRQFPWAMDPRGVCHAVQLLMHDGQSVRPDGLIIADDNMVEPATAGLLAAGVHVPGELEVVAHTNFPWPTRNMLPVKRLGYDVRKTLEACIDLIDRQRRGEAMPPETISPPVFEEQWRAIQGAPAGLGGRFFSNHRS